MSLTMLKIITDQNAILNCLQKHSPIVDKSYVSPVDNSTPFRCSILSVEFNIKVHCRQLQIIGVANTCFRPIFLTRS